MSTREIAPAGWEELCQRFTQLHRGERITLESVSSAGNQVIARDLPLEKLAFDPSGDCSSRLEIHAGEGGNKCVLPITEPYHLVYLENEQGGKSFRIEAESGNYLLHFSSGIISQIVMPESG